MKWVKRLHDGLAKTRNEVRGSLKRLFRARTDPAVLEDLEDALLGADIGVRVTDRLMEQLHKGSTPNGSNDPLDIIRHTLLEIFEPVQSDTLEMLVQKRTHPFVLLTVGINGVGKTTTLAKLGSRFQQAGIKTLMVAGDTFRAAAIEQLEIWGSKIGVEVIRHQQGSDPAAVVFDGIAAAKSRNVDVVLIDTAGRLHTKVNLMEELRKMKRVISRELPGAPHEILLILDATLGQNTIAQAREFHDALGVTGLALTKLDGTARGGVVVAIAEELKIPIRLIGVGETEDDLQDFHSQEFVDALLEIKD